MSPSNFKVSEEFYCVKIAALVYIDGSIAKSLNTFRVLILLHSPLSEGDIIVFFHLKFCLTMQSSSLFL